jgi:hypothetical protein
MPRHVFHLRQIPVIAAVDGVPQTPGLRLGVLILPSAGKVGDRRERFLVFDFSTGFHSRIKSVSPRLTPSNPSTSAIAIRILTQ